MRNRSLVVIVAAAAFLMGGLVVSVVHSQEKTAGDKKAPTPEEMMQIFVKYGTPGKEHEIFKSMVGKFDADVTMAMPGAPAPDKSKGVTTNELLFGGRYMHSDHAGTMMGQPFKGKGLLAYDKLKEKYVNLWIDDMSTMVMVAEGTADASGKVITTTSKCKDPMDGQEKTMRGVMTIVDNDHHTFEMFQLPGSSGEPESKCMTIKYTRAKG
ncbi:MAG: hypothetical protein QOE14_856 [Humisphaera sp.]|nr:hypothetical protein [Humisphaera sp.]